MQAFGSSLAPATPASVATPWPKAGSAPEGSGAVSGGFTDVLQQVMRPGESDDPVRSSSFHSRTEGTRRAPSDEGSRRAADDQRPAAGQPKASAHGENSVNGAPKAGPDGKRSGADQRAGIGSAHDDARTATADGLESAIGSAPDEALKRLDQEAVARDGVDTTAMAANPALQDPNGSYATAPSTSTPTDMTEGNQRLAGSLHAMEDSGDLTSPVASALRPGGLAAAQRQAVTGGDGDSTDGTTAEAEQALEASGITKAQQTADGATPSATHARFTESLQAAQRSLGQDGASLLAPQPGGAATGLGAVTPTASGSAPLGSPSAHASGIPQEVESTLATPLNQPGFAPALGTRITTLVKDGIERASIRLNPAEMGPVAVKLALEGTQVRVEMSADMAATRQVLEQALPSLAGALREAGFTLSGGGVFQQPQGQPGDDPARQGRDGRTSAASHLDDRSGEALAPTSARARVTDSLVDVFA